MEARSPKEVLLTGGTGFIGSRITAELKTMKKSNSMTYKKQRTKIKFIFESTIPQKNFYIRNAHSNIQKLTRLFSVSPSFVVVHVFRNRASFLKAIHKKKVPDWLVALVPPKNTSRIYVFDNKERIASKKLLGQVILHEITHLYTNALNPNLPDWYFRHR